MYGTWNIPNTRWLGMSAPSPSQTKPFLNSPSVWRNRREIKHSRFERDFEQSPTASKRGIVEAVPSGWKTMGNGVPASHANRVISVEYEAGSSPGEHQFSKFHGLEEEAYSMNRRLWRKSVKPSAGESPGRGNAPDEGPIRSSMCGGSTDQQVPRCLQEQVYLAHHRATVSRPFNHEIQFFLRVIAFPISAIVREEIPVPVDPSSVK